MTPSSSSFNTLRIKTINFLIFCTHNKIFFDLKNLGEDTTELILFKSSANFFKVMTLEERGLFFGVP